MSIQIYSYVTANRDIFLRLQKIENWFFVPIIFPHGSLERDLLPFCGNGSLFITKVRGVATNNGLRGQVQIGTFFGKRNKRV